VDFDKPSGQHMLQEAADKFLRGQRAAPVLFCVGWLVEIFEFPVIGSPEILAPPP
jgi:hypothetical protein